MSDYVSNGSLELEVADFGPISGANIELRPFTVFVGPSNTGKSWMAILSYALHRHFGGAFGSKQIWRQVGKFKIFNENLSDAQIDAIFVWVKENFRDGNQVRLFEDSEKPSAQKSFVIPEQIVGQVRWTHSEQGQSLGHEIRRCFGVDSIDGLIRKASRTGANVTIRRHISGESTSFEHRLMIDSQKMGFHATVPGGTEIKGDYKELDYELARILRHITPDEEHSKNDGEIRFLCARLINAIAGLTAPYLFGPLNLPAYYLPADRTGVMHAHSVVVSALIESATMTGIRPTARTPLLSGVLADFLEQLIEIDQPPYQRGKPRNAHASRIEDAILEGSVHVDRAVTTGYPRFIYKPEGWKDGLPLMNASSMVSELAPVVLYLRHSVRPGNLLIIEEPESHLHPGMQVEFMRQLAGLVKSGVRILITTHSEWVLEELANIVRRSQLPVSERKKTDRGEIALRPDQVGAWLFKKKNRPKGSVVEEVKLDDETGLYPTDYDEVSESLYNRMCLSP